MPLLLYLGVVAALVFLLGWVGTRKPKNFPPGPRGLPLLGSILSLGKKAHLTTLQWKEKYGDIYGFYTGDNPIVVLSNMHTVRKVFGEDAAAGRSAESHMRPQNSVLPFGFGLVTSEGDLWKTHRRFALSTLRDLGMGKNWLEDTIIVEVEGFCQVLRETNQKPFNPRIQLTNSVSNIICALIFGQKFSLRDAKFSTLTYLITEHISFLKYEFVSNALPFLMKFPNYVRNKILSGRRNILELAEFLEEKVQEHEQTRRKQADTPDYLHAYQLQRKKDSHLKEHERETFTHRQLLVSLFDLFAAGTDTIATTIMWFFVYMVENPDVMRKVQAEIDSHTGRRNVLTNSDRGALPYTEAVILEVQRFASLLPLGAPHKINEDMNIDGYTIPKGTIVAAHLYSIHRDPRYWTDPDKFDPAHFLDEDFKLIRHDGFAPFSVGKRVCPGEALAKMELFLFIANLLRCFTFEVPPGRTISHKNDKAGVTLSPLPFELIFVPRD